MGGTGGDAGPPARRRPPAPTERVHQPRPSGLWRTWHPLSGTYVLQSWRGPLSATTRRGDARAGRAAHRPSPAPHPGVAPPGAGLGVPYCPTTSARAVRGAASSAAEHPRRLLALLAAAAVLGLAATAVHPFTGAGSPASHHRDEPTTTSTSAPPPT